MRARLLLVGLMTVSTSVEAGPAWAKADIVGATITCPGLEGELRITDPHTDGLWDTGIDVVGGLDDTRAGSIEELGLTPQDLGSRYLATYSFDLSDVLIRQEVYPYAEGGPVTHTPAGQELTVGISMSITSGWYRTPKGFLDYLVDRGLPETDLLASLTTHARGEETAARSKTALWVPAVLVLIGVTTVSVVTARRVANAP